MILNLKTLKNDYTLFGFTVSVIFHIIVFISVAIIMNLHDNETETGVFVQLSTAESLPSLEQLMPGEIYYHKPAETITKLEKSGEIITKEVKNVGKKKDIDNTKPVGQKSEVSGSASGNSDATFYTFSDSLADTSGLVQIYRESTLNVSVKYPAGWKYIDQNVKNKLDGVTFWTTSAKFNPPPYVHIEVQDKDLFNPRRFKYNYKTNGYTVYYNDPEALAGQYNQIIYIRTNTDEDYTLKLIMQGEEAFKMFQPVFFGMVKSFKYGTGYF